MEKLFFQSSLPRAGSTLLQNIMGQNPDFYVTPTSGILELIHSAKNTYSGPSGFECAQHSRPSVERIRRKALLPFESQ